MASTGDSKSCPVSPTSILNKLGLIPSGNGKCTNAITVYGGTNYVALAVSMFNPDLFHRVSPNRDLTNFVLFGTIVGGSAYLYSKPHVACIADPKQRLLFSVYGSAMVSLGSLLLWAMARALLPDNPALRTVIALGSSLTLLKTGVAYIHHVDGLGKVSK